MGKLELRRVRPGMVLSEHVRGRNGRLLLNAGTTIDDDDLRIMRIWGVIEVDIEGVSKEEAETDELAAFSPEVVEHARQLVEPRFLHNDRDNDTVRELMSLCIARTAAMMAGGVARKDTPANPETDLDFGPRLPLVDPKALIHDDLQFGSLPTVFHKLLEVVGDVRSSSADVAEIVTNDPDLSARLLKLVNSPFYGLGAVVDTVSRAVTIVGTNQLVSLAMGITVVTSFDGIPNSFIDMTGFWRHSLCCGIGARLLASHIGMPNTERFFVAGLLHDLGRLLMYLLLPDYAHRALSLAQVRDDLLRNTELEIMGLDHTELSGALLSQWRFPPSLWHMVNWHHDPAGAPEPLDASILCTADVIANALSIGTSGERLVPVLPPEAWEAMGLPVSVLGQVADSMDKQTEDILGFFHTPRD